MLPDHIMTFAMQALAALAGLAMFIAAIRTSYAIEKRSDGTTMPLGVPRYTNLFRTSHGGGSVAQDAETQELVRKLRKQLLYTFIFMLLLAVTTFLNPSGP